MPRDTGDKDKQSAGRVQRTCKVVDHYAETPAAGKNPANLPQTVIPENAEEVTPVGPRHENPVKLTNKVVKGGYADKFVQKLHGPPPSLPRRKDAQPPRDEIMQGLTETGTGDTNRASMSIPVTHPSFPSSQKQAEHGKHVRGFTIKDSEPNPIMETHSIFRGNFVRNTTDPNANASGETTTSANNYMELEVLEHPKTLDYSTEDVKVNEDPDKVEDGSFHASRFSRYQGEFGSDVHDHFPHEDVPSRDVWNRSSNSPYQDLPFSRPNEEGHRQRRQPRRSLRENIQYVDELSSDFINCRRQEELICNQFTISNTNGNMKSIAEEEAKLRQAREMSRIIAENNPEEMEKMYDTMTSSEKTALDQLLRHCLDDFVADATLHARNDVDIISKSSKNIINWGFAASIIFVIALFIAASARAKSSFLNLEFDEILPPKPGRIARMYKFVFGL